MSGLLASIPPLAYVGRPNCITGYGAAARHQIHILRQHGLRLKIVDAGSEGDPDPDRQSELVQSTRKSDSGTDQPKGTIIHAAPNMAMEWTQRHPRPHILVFVWETTRLPAAWVRIANGFDQVWCATQWQADVCITSGVDRAKVRHVPFALDPALYPQSGPTLPELDALRQQGYFLFGSIFQWSERKAPRALIGAFLSAFQKREKVVLVLKSYEGTNAASSVQSKVQEIVASYAPVSVLPEIRVVSRRLNHSETLGFFGSLDCYVSAHRGEGWCVLPGAPVTVRGGVKPIEEVQIGDDVLASDGQFHRVHGTPTRQYRGPVVEIRAPGMYAPLCLTPEHEVRVVRGAGKRFSGIDGTAQEWVRADHVNVGDLLFVPRPRVDGDLPSELDLAAYLPADKFCVDDTHVWSRMGFTPSATEHSYTALVEAHGYSKKVFEGAVRHIRNGTTPKAGTQCAAAHQILLDLDYAPAVPVKMRRHVPVDDALLRFLGIYVADGCTESGQRILLALNTTTKADLAQFVAQYCATAFGLDAKIVAGGGQRLDVRVCGTALATAMAALCGQGAIDKRVPAFLMDAPGSAAPFVYGYLRGDGCEAVPGNVSATTVSVELAWQLRHLLAARGFLASLTRHRRDRGLPIYCLHVGGRQLAAFSDVFGVGHDADRKTLRRSNAFLGVPEGFLVRVKTVERRWYVGDVHDLSVEDVHDFECAGFTVHNCLPQHEALLLGKRVIATDWSAPAEWGAGCYHPVAYTLEAPHSMGWQPFYHLDQEWASPDQGSMSAWMRSVHAGTAGAFPEADVKAQLHSLPERAGEAASKALGELFR